MASPNIYAGGLGGSTGQTLTTIAPIYTSGLVYYVSSVGGSDSNTGKERTKPFATLAAAAAVAVASDTIVLFANHAESLLATPTLNSGASLVGEGTGATRPHLTCANTTGIFAITVPGVFISNIYFPASTSAPSIGRIRIGGNGVTIDNCYFECGALDTAGAITCLSSTVSARIANTTLISTSTSTAPVGLDLAGTNADTTLDTVTFDGGTVGWSTYGCNFSAATTRLRATNVSLLRDSDAFLATGSTGYLHVGTTTGSARVVWTA